MCCADTSKQISDIIAEANVAFTLNMKMFQELNASFVKIMVMLLLNAIGNLKLNKRIFANWFNFVIKPLKKSNYFMQLLLK